MCNSHGASDDVARGPSSELMGLPSRCERVSFASMSDMEGLSV